MQLILGCIAEAEPEEKAGTSHVDFRIWHFFEAPPDIISNVTDALRATADEWISAELIWQPIRLHRLVSVQGLHSFFVAHLMKFLCLASKAASAVWVRTSSAARLL